jgi:hypothetical protein
VLAKAAADISAGNTTQAGDDAKPNADEPKREAAMAAAAASDGSSSTAELSNIVDNMLAELKPRLMAELAKKLEQKK